MKMIKDVYIYSRNVLKANALPKLERLPAMKIIYSLFILLLARQLPAAVIQDTTDYPYKLMPAIFPGTNELKWTGDLSSKMLDGAHRFIDEKLKASVNERKKRWSRDLTSPTLYTQSI